jgi:hypothetical protein
LGLQDRLFFHVDQELFGFDYDFIDPPSLLTYREQRVCRGLPGLTRTQKANRTKNRKLEQNVTSVLKEAAAREAHKAPAGSAEGKQ